MTKNEKIEVNGIEEELKEEKINELKDYSPIIKDLRIVPQKTKFNTYYNLQVTLNGTDAIIKIKCDEDLVQFISTCTKLGKNPVQRKTVVEEENVETSKKFTCVKIVTRDDKTYRYFLSRANESLLALLLEDYKEKNQK